MPIRYSCASSDRQLIFCADRSTDTFVFSHAWTDGQEIMEYTYNTFYAILSSISLEERGLSHDRPR